MVKQMAYKHLQTRSRIVSVNVCTPIKLLNFYFVLWILFFTVGEIHWRSIVGTYIVKGYKYLLKNYNRRGFSVTKTTVIQNCSHIKWVILIIKI